MKNQILTGERAGRVALFGGSFDPIHNGHLSLAEWCLSELDLDQLIFLPNHKHPFAAKINTTSGDHRLNMIRLALSPYKKLVVDDFELQNERTSYTIDTVKYFREKYPDTKMFYLIGDDNVMYFSKWKDYDHLQKLVQFIVFKRQANDPAGSGHNFEFQYLNNPIVEISSTLIRERIKTNLSFRAMIPVAVYEYILKNNLYSA